MDGYLSNKPNNFVDDPEKLYRPRRREAHQAKKLDFVDSESEDKGSQESPKNFYRLPFTPPSLVRRIGPSPSSVYLGFTLQGYKSIDRRSLAVI
jgi:hypothetical protein